MKKNRNNKGLWLDTIVLFLIIGVIVLCGFAIKAPKPPEGELLVLWLNVTRDSDIIYPEAAKLGKAYFNSSNFPVSLLDVAQTTRNGLPAIEIAVEGRGSIEEDRVVFNGQRILIGQKAELHGNFFAQGVIQSVSHSTN